MSNTAVHLILQPTFFKLLAPESVMLVLGLGLKGQKNWALALRLKSLALALHLLAFALMSLALLTITVMSIMSYYQLC